jgi:hypothetical protein
MINMIGVILLTLVLGPGFLVLGTGYWVKLKYDSGSLVF